MRPGVASVFKPKEGIEKEWMTSWTGFGLRAQHYRALIIGIGFWEYYTIAIVRL